MGLDQYAYVTGQKGDRDRYYEGAQYNGTTGEFENPNMPAPQELAYWRKHPNLQGWMENLWRESGMPGTGNDDATFNGIELELTWDDVDRLERDILAGTVAQLGTTGFFFGHASDDHYREHDLAFCRAAKAELFVGRRVFYNSSW